MDRYTDMQDVAHETRRDMNAQDKHEILAAIAEIERDTDKITYLVKAYKKIIINNILKNKDVPEMLNLLERLNNAQTPKAS
jgi:hypothetical protein